MSTNIRSQEPQPLQTQPLQMPAPPEPPGGDEPPPPGGVLDRLRRQLARARSFAARHERLLWWGHSLYALGLGLSVVLFAQKSFEHTRILLWSGGGAWLLLLLLTRVQRWQDERGDAELSGKPRWGFLAITYVLKNLYQGMLFFALPFYFKASSFDSANVLMLVLLGAFALLSTLDVVFDQVVVRRTWVASIFHGVALFACINLITPAVLPSASSSTALVLAAVISALGGCSLHLARRVVATKKALFLLAGVSVCSASCAYLARRYVPPVPMHLSYARVGPGILEDGRLTMEVSSLHASVLNDVYAITDVALPGGKREELVHVWRHEGEAVYESDESTARVPGPEGGIRLRSVLPRERLPHAVRGAWSVDVETLDGRLVGRARFVVTE